MKIVNAGNRFMNTYVYRSQAGYIMIDTGYEHSLKRVQKCLWKHGIALSDIRFVFLTHAHDDHAGFLNELLSKCPAVKVILHAQAIPVLFQGQNSFDGGCSGFAAFAFCKLMAFAGKGKHLFPAVEEQYADRLLILSPENLDKLETLLHGTILFTPGHTADSISLKIGNLIFCGDAAMNGMPSFHRITIWMEDQAAFYRSWKRLIAEKADFIFPAHGKPFPSNNLKKYIRYIRNVTLYRLK